MPAKLTILPVGPLQANCYVLGDAAGAAVVIDPGGDADRLVAACREMKPELILLTHGHVDHIAAAAALKREWGARVLAHAEDWHFVEKPHPFFAQMVGGVEACQMDGALEDGQELQAGEITLRVLHTPGHSPGSVCFFWDGSIFTGDTLFAGSVGRTDLPGGSWPTLETSLRKLIAATEPQTVIYPGHGPATTMAAEADENTFLQDL